MSTADTWVCMEETMKKKTFQIELECEAFDTIVANDLQSHYTKIADLIRKLRKKVKKTNKCFYIEELKYHENLLPAIRAVGAFYGKKIK